MSNRVLDDNISPPPPPTFNTQFVFVGFFFLSCLSPNRIQFLIHPAKAVRKIIGRIRHVAVCFQYGFSLFCVCHAESGEEWPFLIPEKFTGICACGKMHFYRGRLASSHYIFCFSLLFLRSLSYGSHVHWLRQQKIRTKKWFFYTVVGATIWALQA